MGLFVRLIQIVLASALLCAPVSAKAADNDTMLGTYGLWELWRGVSPGTTIPACYLVDKSIQGTVNGKYWGNGQAFIMLADKHHDLIIIYNIVLPVTENESVAGTFAFANGEIVNLQMRHYPIGYVHAFQDGDSESSFYKNVWISSGATFTIDGIYGAIDWEDSNLAFKALDSCLEALPD